MAVSHPGVTNVSLSTQHVYLVSMRARYVRNASIGMIRPQGTISNGTPAHISPRDRMVRGEYPRSRNASRIGSGVFSIMERVHASTLLNRSRGTTTMVTVSDTAASPLEWYHGDVTPDGDTVSRYRRPGEGDQFPVQSCMPPGVLAGVVILHRPSERTFAHLVSKRRTCNHPRDGRPECVEVSRRHQQTGSIVHDQLGDAPDGQRHYRQSARHRLSYHHPERFATRGMDEEVRGLEPWRDVGLEPGPGHPSGEQPLAGLLQHRRSTLGSGAEHHQVPRLVAEERVGTGRRSQDLIDPLFGPEMADRQRQSYVRSQPEPFTDFAPSRAVGPEAVQIDSNGDHRDLVFRD